MKIPRPPHNWSVSPGQAIAIQRRLAQAIRLTKPRRQLRYIAGVDAAFSSDNRFCLAGILLWDRETGAVTERQTARRRLIFPYVPGLLTFREGPAIIAAMRKLRWSPDCLICDGQGIAHPRRCGIASHLGILTGLPSIGCAKSRLVGSSTMPGKTRGERSPLLAGDEILGAVLRTCSGVNPVFISVGTGMDLGTAVPLIMDCCRGFRLPEPVRLAHQLVKQEKKRHEGLLY